METTYRDRETIDSTYLVDMDRRQAKKVIQQIELIDRKKERKKERKKGVLGTKKEECWKHETKYKIK